MYVFGRLSIRHRFNNFLSSFSQIVLLAAVCAAEPPSHYGAPPPSNYGPPRQSIFLTPVQPQSNYGPPSNSYGPPSYNQIDSTSHHHNVRTEITKDIYVHVPPPDQEEFEGGHPQPIVNKKNYKIIFIKAPSVSIDQMARFQQQSQQEEKTIVYVLSKKPELDTELITQQNNNKKPSKPEVYFIKYKTQKERTHVDVNAPYP